MHMFCICFLIPKFLHAYCFIPQHSLQLLQLCVFVASAAVSGILCYWQCNAVSDINSAFNFAKRDPSPLSLTLGA